MTAGVAAPSGTLHVARPGRWVRTRCGRRMTEGWVAVADVTRVYAPRCRLCFAASSRADAVPQNPK